MIEVDPYIPRPFYVRQLRPYIGSHIIKILTGQRRAGKSFMLYQLIDELRREQPQANIIYINTELAEFRPLHDEAGLYAYIKPRIDGSGPHYVFIDEIQEINRFELALRSLFAEGRCDLYCTGSNAHLLSGELATHLAGRYVQFTIHPLSYAEFLDFYRCGNTPETLQKYLRIGGMPYLAALENSSQAGVQQREGLAAEYLRNLYESILLRDVIARENIRNVRFLESLAAYLADNTGSLFSARNISGYLKNQKLNIPVQTVISYLEALEKSMLIHRVRRADIKGLKIFEIGDKYYFEDIGIRNVLVRNPRMDTAKLVEQAVCLFLLQRGFTVYVGKLDNAEIDFVALRQAERIYVQAAYRIGDEAVYQREFGNLERIPDQHPKYVVTLDEDMPPVNSKGIRWMNLKDFLVMEL
ncbi:MAG: ATP-binding protein [Treponema sp.]|jgi:predicted AAA+ superfamily ATPase|nr:ATP-binding protein [Treponema sp.]